MQEGKAKMRKIRFFYWIGHTTQWKMQQIKTQASSNVDIKEQRSRLIVLSTSK